MIITMLLADLTTDCTVETRILCLSIHWLPGVSSANLNVLSNTVDEAFVALY